MNSFKDYKSKPQALVSMVIGIGINVNVCFEIGVGMNRAVKMRELRKMHENNSANYGRMRSLDMAMNREKKASESRNIRSSIYQRWLDRIFLAMMRVLREVESHPLK